MYTMSYEQAGRPNHSEAHTLHAWPFCCHTSRARLPHAPLPFCDCTTAALCPLPSHLLQGLVSSFLCSFLSSFILPDTFLKCCCRCTHACALARALSGRRLQTKDERMSWHSIQAAGLLQTDQVTSSHDTMEGRQEMVVNIMHSFQPAGMCEACSSGKLLCGVMTACGRVHMRRIA